MTRARPNSRADGGFTLLEILVGLVVLGLILVGLSQGMQFGLKAWGTQARLVEEHADLDAVDRALRHLIEQMDPGTYAELPQIRGSATALEFVTELPIVAGALATHHADVRLLLDQQHRLVLRWRPHAHVTPLQGLPSPQETELLRGVDGLEIKYWRGTANGGGAWVTTWENSRTLPNLVRIRIRFPARDRRHWPDLIAAPLRERAEG